MSAHKNIHWLWLVGVGILILDVAILWSVRVVPSGYSSWILVARIVAGLVAGDPAYVGSYSFVNVPVPNCALVALVAGLGPIFTFEGAGKLVISILVVSLPLGVLAANKALHGGDGLAPALLTIPFAMSWQVFLSQNCIIGLALIVWGVAYYGWRRNKLCVRDLHVFAGILVLVYFSHGLSFVLAIAVTVGIVFLEPLPWRQRFLSFGLVIAPSALLAFWYALGSHPVLTHAGSWSIFTVLQSALKPLVLFMRVNGVESPVPPSYGNLPWFMVCGVFLLVSMQRALKKRNLDLRFVTPVVFCLCCVLVLPDPLLGIDQPGTRFMIPLIVFLILLLGRVRIQVPWGVALVGVALAAALYNLFWFGRFDEKASQLFQDLDGATQGREAAYVLALDWPQATAFSERISAYAGGLSGIPQLYNARKNLIAEIPETGPVIMNPTLHARFPAPAGTDLASWTTSILTSYPLLEKFSQILVVGKNDESARSIRNLLDHEWQIAVQGEAWTILRSPLRTAGPR